MYFGWPPSNRIHGSGCVRVLGRVRLCMTWGCRMIDGTCFFSGQSELELCDAGLAGGCRLWDRAVVNDPAVLVAFLKGWGTRGFLEWIRAWTKCNRTNDMDIGYFGAFSNSTFLAASLTTATFGSLAKTVRAQRVLGWLPVGELP